jgi:hypothetical protein
VPPQVIHRQKGHALLASTRTKNHNDDPLRQKISMRPIITPKFTSNAILTFMIQGGSIVPCESLRTSLFSFDISSALGYVLVRLLTKASLRSQGFD